jgi:hypothetical protein
MALVPPSSFHRYYAYLPTFKMVYQTFKVNSFRPSSWYWNHRPPTCYTCRLGCHQLLLGNNWRLRWVVLTSIYWCPNMRHVLLLLCPTFDQKTRRLRILLRSLD